MIERCCLAVLATGSQMDATLTYYPTFSSGEMVGHGLGQDQIITRERSSYEMEGLIPFFINV